MQMMSAACSRPWGLLLLVLLSTTLSASATEDEAQQSVDDIEKKIARLEVHLSTLEEKENTLKEQLANLEAAHTQATKTTTDQINKLRQHIEQLKTGPEGGTPNLFDPGQDFLEQILGMERELRLQEHKLAIEEKIANAKTAAEREMWKNEQGNALREINNEYDEKQEMLCSELEIMKRMSWRSREEDEFHL